MVQPLYVAVDGEGNEHAPAGPVHWSLPAAGTSIETSLPAGLVLRHPDALLDALDEHIFRAEVVEGVVPCAEGVRASSARLLAETPWDTEVATGFALSCVEHILGDNAEVKLPNGATLGEVIADARNWLAGLTPEAGRRLGYLSEVALLRRLRREREELSEIDIAVVSEDAHKDVDAMNDSAYVFVASVIDAVLAVIEALRHHVLFHFQFAADERIEEREEHRNLDGELDLTPPTLFMTPLGPMPHRGSHVGHFEPAWTAAEEAARHARLFVKDRTGVDAEAAERAWQATQLGAALEGAAPVSP